MACRKWAGRRFSSSFRTQTGRRFGADKTNKKHTAHSWTMEIIVTRYADVHWIRREMDKFMDNRTMRSNSSWRHTGDTMLSPNASHRGTKAMESASPPKHFRASASLLLETKCFWGLGLISLKPFWCPHYSEMDSWVLWIFFNIKTSDLGNLKESREKSKEIEGICQLSILIIRIRAQFNNFEIRIIWWIRLSVRHGLMEVQPVPIVQIWKLHLS